MLEEIDKTVNVLTQGGVILYPTDTIWGIGCDATNQKAVERIYKIKKRIESKSLIILVSDTEMLKEYVSDTPDIAWDLVNNVDRPTTFIYPKAKNLAKKVVASDGSVAIRVVSDEFCRQMITLFGKPIVSTSANISGEPTALFFNKVSAEIKKNVNYIVGLYHDTIREIRPSTLIRLFSSGEYEIIRK
jgi:L-threonylcarbamoyladenylate synthase